MTGSTSRAGLIVGVQLAHLGDHRVREVRARLDEHGRLGVALALALPDIDRRHAGEDVDAGGEPAIHQRAADPLGLGRRGSRVDQNGLVVFTALERAFRVSGSDIELQLTSHGQQYAQKFEKIAFVASEVPEARSALATR